MVDPIIVGVGGAAFAVGAAAVYAFTTGRATSASVDIDNDGEEDASVTFNKAQARPKTDNITPSYVRKYDGLKDIKGIGPQRAKDLNKAGLSTPKDIYYASDDTLLDVVGIGPRSLDIIRTDIGGVDQSGYGGDVENSKQGGLE